MSSMAALDRLHLAMQARVEKREMPGIVTLVAQGGEVHVDAIGVTEFDGAEPMRRQTLFRIASMTKPVLAAVSLMLMEEGVLRPEEPVQKWLPELAHPRVLVRPDAPLDETVAARRPITVDDLLTFRFGSGILVEPIFDPPVPVVLRARELQLSVSEPDPRTPHTPDEWIKRFASLPLMYQPGERWLYNFGSLVLGVLLARASAQPLGDLLQDRVFQPLGMQHTGFWLPLELTRGLPAYYMTNAATGQLERRDVSTPEEWSTPPVFPSGAGGLVSTVDDFLQFARMLLNGGVHEGRRLLSENSVEVMTRNHLTNEQVATAGMILGGQGWGYGVAVALEADAAWPVAGRYGWAGGYGTTWFNDPHRQIVAIAMTQVSDFMWNGGLAEFEVSVGAL
jgi:CubicO group peptidase (beta-lactamase class C family)